MHGSLFLGPCPKFVKKKKKDSQQMEMKILECKNMESARSMNGFNDGSA